MQKFIRDVLKEKVLDSEPINSPVAAFALSLRLSCLLSWSFWSKKGARSEILGSLGELSCHCVAALNPA